MFNEIKKTIEFGGASLELATGKIARQADGAVMVRQGDTMLLCTAVSAKSVKEGTDFFPMTVNYLEKTYAAGKIPGGFLKREGGGRSEREVLVSRLIDRPIRPLFHPSFFNETQVMCTVHSHDTKHQSDVLAIIGASAALAIAGVPYQEIVAAARVGLIDGQLVVNPSYAEMIDSDLDLVVAGTSDSVMMVESEANLLPEAKMLEAVKLGHEAFQPVIQAIEELAKEVGNPKWEVEDMYPASLKDEIRDLCKDDITAAFAIGVKQERYAAVDAIKAKMMEKFTADGQFNELQVNMALAEVKSEVLRNDTLAKSTRIDGRNPDQVRAIECEVDLFPGAHGSSLFTRGETQAIVTTTLGTGQDEQILESLDGEYRERFLLNYIFPPYSVGEAGPLRAPSRREIGHGKLAWRALSRALPSKTEFPYTLRVVSEITESNGSSSMATVCGASMAMMDAGVPLAAPIAGIAMGLIKEGDDFLVLSDIIADEDHLGDMDFKVAGSEDGVTALQMDIKVSGITFDIMEKALDQAKAGRLHILGKMANAITEKKAISDNAPLIESFTVKKDKIREIIGPGGAVIKDICETTGAKIDINDDGEVSVYAVGRDKLEAAVEKVKAIAFDPEVGGIFEGKVVKIIDAGAFVNFHGNRDGFVHISEIADERINSIGNFLEEGQMVRVKLIGYERGKAKLTIRNADRDVPLNAEKPKGDRPKRPNDRGDRGDRGERRDREDRGERRDREDRGDRVDRESREKSGSKKKKISEMRKSDDGDDVETKERKYFN